MYLAIPNFFQETRNIYVKFRFFNLGKSSAWPIVAPLSLILALVLTVTLMRSVFKKEWSYFTTYWPEYLLLLC